MELVNLPRIKEQFTRTFGFVVVAVAVAEFGDVGVDKPNFSAIFYLGIAFGNRPFAKTQRFHLGSGQSNASLKLVLDIKIIARAPVFGDGFDLIKRFGFRACH